jgi:hypothetical protein
MSAESAALTSKHSSLVRCPELVASSRLYKNELCERIVSGGSNFFAAAAPHSTPMAALEGMSSVGAGKNIVGLGFGLKIVNGRVSHERALLVYVRRKDAKARLSIDWAIPAEVNGMPTDVVEIGEPQSLGIGGLGNAGGAMGVAVAPGHPTPTECGLSIGHFNGSAGTIGCVVDLGSGEPHILSAAHVLAPPTCSCSWGDRILQPAQSDGGSSPHFASLVDWTPIDFTHGGVNHMDAAIAVVNVPHRSVSKAIAHIGAISLPHVEAVAGQRVAKVGRSTSHRTGTIFDIDFDVKGITYSNYKSANFEGQIAIQSDDDDVFAERGDSGALVVDACSKAPVGLLFAVGGRPGQKIGISTPIEAVLNKFRASIVTLGPILVWTLNRCSRDEGATMTISELKKAKKALWEKFRGLEGIVALGVGNDAVNVYVRDLATAKGLPASFCGAKLNILVVGEEGFVAIALLVA